MDPVHDGQSAELGRRIRAAREDRNLKQGHLAKLCGLSQPYLSNLERGDKLNPSLSVLHKIAEALGVEVSWLTTVDSESTEAAAG